MNPTPTPRAIYSRPSRANSPRTCLTNGQWLQMNITSSAGAPAKSPSRTIFPRPFPSGFVTSGSAKPGAAIPSSGIVESVRAMPR